MFIFPEKSGCDVSWFEINCAICCANGNDVLEFKLLSLFNDKSILRISCLHKGHKLLRSNHCKICGSEKINNAPLGYSLAKSSLNFYVKLISDKLSKKGITINSIAPGNIYFKGSTWEKHLKKNHRKTINYIKENVPQGKFGTIDDVANLCEFLSSDKSKFITGATYIIDGGQTRRF